MTAQTAPRININTPSVAPFAFTYRKPRARGDPSDSSSPPSLRLLRGASRRFIIDDFFLLPPSENKRHPNYFVSAASRPRTATSTYMTRAFVPIDNKKTTTYLLYFRYVPVANSNEIARDTRSIEIRHEFFHDYARTAARKVLRKRHRGSQVE